MAEAKGVDILPLVKNLKTRRELIEVATQQLRQDTGAFVLAMAKAEIPVRDTAHLLGVSPQRVSQIAAEALRRQPDV